MQPAYYKRAFLFCGLFFSVSLLCLPVEARKKKKKHHLLKPVHVRNITIITKNVFDPAVPGENFWLFRVANALHIQTRPSVVRRQLLVYPGDWTDLAKLEESERNLRALPFIKDAGITPVSAPDGETDLLVKTQDSWTTQPQLNFSSEGNQSTFSAGFEEINLLGYGKDVSYFYKKDAVNGVSHQLGYSDPQLFNSRLNLVSAFQDSSTGNTEDVNLALPFYSLTTRNAAGIALDHTLNLQRIFENGSQISQYDQTHFSANPFYGLWANNDPLNVLRVQINYRYTEDTFHSLGVVNTPPGTLPSNDALSGPILSSSFIQSDFIKETFADKAGRVEDINLGHQSNIGLGYAGRDLGATENSLPFSINDSFGFGGDSGFGLASYGTTSRYQLYDPGQMGGKLFNTLYFANINYYRHLTDSFPMTGVIHLESAYLQNPATDNVLTLGGNSGLRGYPNNSFTGNKSLLFNVEDRFYDPHEFLHLAYMGGAVFADVGEVRPQDLGFDTKDIHADIGLGMRFGLSRSSAGTVFRVDLAYAVGPVVQSNRWILSISSSQGFGQTANTYANFPTPTTTQ